MKTEKEQNFEREIPAGYRQALYINAKNAKFGIIFNLIAVLVLVAVMALALLSLTARDISFAPSDVDSSDRLIAYFVFLILLIAYVILHELVHGIAYKSQTGEKLTFGMSWSCAFCGVPNIYTYRKTALIAVVAPFAVFTLLFIPILIYFYFFNSFYYVLIAFIFGMHLGGCSGDLYVLYLLTARFKDEKTLMRDTGPEQFFYVPEDESALSSDDK
ncbi:MAG: DUF3267 domain-containing protein [Ruminococcaceae bacterium]|nr:DUF3267 domain-containing protein [Oscillospiraceae bacterium]